MSVDVQRGAAGHMADDRGKGLHIHAVLQGGSGEGMPQIVEPNPGQSGSFQYPVEHVQDAVWGDWAAGRRGKYPVAAADFFLLLF